MSGVEVALVDAAGTAIALAVRKRDAVRAGRRTGRRSGPGWWSLRTAGTAAAELTGRALLPVIWSRPGARRPPSDPEEDVGSLDQGVLVGRLSRSSG